MTDTLKEIADQDTPAAVNVPATPSGLAIWAMGRWGISIVVLYAAWIMLNRVYEDSKEMNVQLIETIKSGAKRDTELVLTLAGLRDSINKLSEEVRDLKRQNELSASVRTKPLPATQ